MRSRSLRLLVTLAAVAGVAAAQEAPVFDLADVQRGLRGYGLSVFAGTAPERFEVEVLGLVRNLHPDTSFILARLTGKGLEKSGVIAGMSGSPVYLDDRLAGAVAFSWSFAQEAIAGITPIAAMRDLGTLPRAPTAAASGEPIRVEQLAAGRFPTELLAEHLASLKPRSLAGASSNLQWGTVGFGEASRSLLEQALGPVAPAGSQPELDAPLEGGSAVAGVLVGGDFQLAVTGTVTERRGDEVLAFGHPYLGLGPISVPMASAEVLTVVSSRANSFKVANVGPIVGAFEEDRLVGLLGRVGAVAPTIPLSVRIGGSPGRTFELQLARIPQMTPSLAAVSVLEGLDAARHRSGDQDLEMAVRIELAGHEPIETVQHFDGPSSAISAGVYLLSLASFLLEDPTEEVHIERIEVDLSQAPAPRTVTLLAAHTSRLAVRPGDEIELHLDLERYRGEKFRRSFPLRIPADLAPGPYFLFAGDAGSVDVARLQMEPWEPRDLTESLALLRSFHRTGELVMLGAVPRKGLLVEGRSLPSLPGSIRSIWSAAGPLAAKGLRLAVHDQNVASLDFPLSGAARIDLRILADND